MAGIDVILLYTSEFGSKGAGDNNFDLPSSLCLANDRLYIVDKQNHRIKVHELNGDFVFSFGTVGSGNDNFFFPEGITTDGVNVYIADGANHRVKAHDLNGVFVSEFGTAGSGNTNFQYPVGITFIGTDLWIADKQNNRIKQHTTAGAFVSQITGFNFPEGVATINGEVVIADSANKNIDFYTTGGSFLRRSPAVLEYPTQIKETNGILTVLDKQASRLAFLDAEGVFIEYFGEEGTAQNNFLFPIDVVYDDDALYILDSGNYRVKNYAFTVEEDVPEFADLFLRLTKRLYPTGRAWWMRKNGVFEKTHLGLAYSESRIKTVFEDLLNSILPDNDFFSVEDATKWESALGLYNQSALDLEVRKTSILRKMRYPGEAISRQHYTFIEGQLQAAGFDVYVHENRFGDPPSVVTLSAATYGSFVYGGLTYGADGFAGSETIANYIDAAKDAGFVFGGPDNLRATFFIGGEVFGDFAVVDPERKNEFRELILKLKPAQTAGILLITFNPWILETGVWNDSGSWIDAEVWID